MKSYLGTKIIQAEPMNLADYKKGQFDNEKDRHLSVKMLIKDSKMAGYLVKYSDSYTSWSPKEVFEIAYRLITPDEAKLIVGDGAVFVVNQNKDRRELLEKGLESEDKVG